MKYIAKIIYLISPSERKQTFFLLIMIFFMALLDMIGVASIMPFMAMLANPQLVETSSFISYIYNLSGIFGVANTEQFLFFLGIGVFVLLIISLGFRALTFYLLTLFSEMLEYSIGKRLVESYLYQSYSWFLNKNSMDLGKNVLSEVNQVIEHTIVSVINIIAYGTITIALLLLLIFVDPFISAGVGLVLIVAYGAIYISIKSHLSRTGLDRFKTNQSRFSILSESFGAIKEIKLGGLENIFLNRFSKPALIYAKRQTSAKIISQLPRFALEAIAFGGIIIIALILIKRSDNFSNAIPILSLYAFAGYRLMPGLQLIYNGVVNLRFSLPALDALHRDLISLKEFNRIPDLITAMPLLKDITLNNIYYSYNDKQKPILKNINLTIPVFSKVAIVGATGSGKSTTLDVILGLIRPQQGSLMIDGKVVNNNNRREWQKSVGYVPQQIYLADDTLKANIAFGVDPHKINQKLIEKVAKIANIHDFAINALPKNYDTVIGERGIRLSGGQRQRIGIARALYHEPKVIALDEATSSLDNVTEQAVMEAVSNLHKNITIVLIAHRLSTVKDCDCIFYLEQGELVAQGDFEKLIDINKNFREMAKREI